MHYLHLYLVILPTLELGQLAMRLRELRIWLGCPQKMIKNQKAIILWAMGKLIGCLALTKSEDFCKLALKNSKKKSKKKKFSFKIEYS
jgi:hypothetical protein